MTNYMTPPLPAGYEHIGGTWDTGYIIRRSSDMSELVWIPVAALDADGSIDGRSYDRKFGCRSYGYRRDDECGFERRDNPAFDAQLKSVEKYGGFYITRYAVSRGKDGKPASVKGVPAWTMINRRDAESAARGFEAMEGVSSHLPYAAEQDCVFAWLIKCGLLTADEIARAGAQRNTRNPNRSMGHTGCCGEKAGIYDVAANIDEWSQESYDGSFSWGCGSNCQWPGTSRCYFLPYACYTFTGYRAVLCIE